MSKVYSLKAIQKIPVDINTAWNFFSKPDNLKDITPDMLGFKVISKHHGDKIYAGQIIEYKVSPFAGIPLYWMTEISHVEDKKYFVDEQRYGPYSLWHHQHHFEIINDDVEMTDIVHYKIPFWFLGDIANAIVVRNKLKEIFEYRFKVVEEKFGKCSQQKCNILFA
jgi:ligand-binding SRPBCC domain-containing protein